MRVSALAAIAAAAFSLALVTVAAADDWVAVKLRGPVFAFAADGWQPLHRGDVVSDERPIYTQDGGHVLFQRDGETIDVGSNTRFSIKDRTGERYTTVDLSFGQVAIEANVENVKHFAVETTDLAAVVKGTKFVVIAGNNGGEVVVSRGHVEVTAEQTHRKVVVSAGQSASVSGSGVLTVAGLGKLPVVLNFLGQPLALPNGATGDGTSTPSDEESGIFVVGLRSAPGGSNDTSDDTTQTSTGNGKGNSGVGQGNGGGNGTSNEGNGNGPGEHGNSSGEHGNSANSNAGGKNK